MSLSCTHEKHHLGSATPRRMPRNLTCCIPSITARQTRPRLKHPCLIILAALKPRKACNPRTHSEPPRQLHDMRGNMISNSNGRGLRLTTRFRPCLQHPFIGILEIIKFRTAFEPRTFFVHSRQLYDSRRSGLCLATSLSIFSSQWSLRYTRGSRGLVKQLRLAGKYNKLIEPWSNTFVEI